MIDVATSLAGARRSLARAEATDDVHCVLGIHPHEAASFDLARSTSCSELLGHPRAVAVGETGLDYFRDYAPPEAQQRALRRAARARAANRQARRHPHPRGRRRHARPPARARRPGDPPLLLLAAVARRRARARLVGVIRRQRHLQERLRPTRRRPARAGGPPARRDRQPLSRAAGGARQARTSRRTSCTRSPRSPTRAASTPAELEAQIDRNADEVFSL